MEEYYTGYYSSSPSPSPQQTEKTELRSAAGFVGVQMIALTISMQFAYTLVAILLMAVGFLSPSALSMQQLGLDNTTFLLVYSCVYFLAMGTPLLFAIGRKHLFSLTPARRSVTASVGFWGVLGAVGVCMGANILTSMLLTLLEQWDVPIPEMPDMMVNTPISYLLNIFVIALLPAVLEEALFRGCVLRTLRPFGDGFAVFVSAVLFGLMHGNIRQIPFAFIVGLILGWLYITTNCIVFPMVVHFANNALSVTMEYLGYRLPDANVNLFYAWIIYGLAIVGAVAMVVLFVSSREEIRLRRSMTTLPIGSRFAALFKSPAFVIALVLFIGLAGLELIA